MGRENLETVVLQAHMDMVCEKRPDSLHDFSKDPIQLRFWKKDGISMVSAVDTTLGADNGIGVAYALVAACATSRPALEILLTSDEEEGLTGAQNLSDDFVSGKYLLNLDSEEEGILIAGCAGGVSLSFKKSFDPCFMENSASSPFSYYSVRIFGLLGGHSGTDIDKPRANANVLLGNLLRSILEKINKTNDINKTDINATISTFPTKGSELELRLVNINGGSVHNAIPREAACTFMTDLPLDFLNEMIQEFQSVLEKTIRSSEPNLKFSFDKMERNEINKAANEKANILESNPVQIPVFNSKNTARIISLISSIPHGVFEMSDKIPGLVLTSGNLAVMRSEFFEPEKSKENTKDKKLEFKITYSLRSGNEFKLKEKSKEFIDIGENHDFHVSVFGSYKPWEPDFDSGWISLCKKVYKHHFLKEIQVSAIHAGLECGVLGRKYPSLQMVSLGPDISNAHTPDETMNLDSAKRVWVYIQTILENFDVKKQD
ncbi:Cytosol non-specific dipeptidase [Methanolapillus ohkumae]|uniref:Cytosol non-specific dipeptidase n=1 Tax=Methanolapillus ohkumae TaxID=3028298 RepID=A0AA96V6G8_9EURY|nr:Cytosol non-specific dipeptidase [Methanosarcinaceae archaeon Am2]